MIALLIAAIAGIALLAGGGFMIMRSRDRRRRERQARAAAVAGARARARADEERRRALADADDELTSVIPAIRLPWPTKLAEPRSNGQPDPGGPLYPDLDGEYPRFATLAPFQAAPYDTSAAGAGRLTEPGPFVPEPFGPEPFVPEPFTTEPFVPAPAQAPASGPPSAARVSQPDPPFGDGHAHPVPRQDEGRAAAVPDRHGAAADRNRGRSAHGSHRASHARRRRG